MTTNNAEKKIITVGGLTPAIIEKVLLEGDLSKLTAEERLHYYQNVCVSLGLNPLTKPFDYIILDRKLVLYARKDATEQLRKIHLVSITDLTTDKHDDVFVVTAKAKDRDGRTDAATGAVSLVFTDDAGMDHKLKGIGLANAIMKAETKAKRRVTLSICGLGMFDESELDTVTAPVSEAIVERNVREATANATGGVVPMDASDTEPANEYGPLEIRESNYKQLKSHVGKAQGNMLGQKVGDLHENVIKWMYQNWREKLGPSASEQDLRLKKAIEFAYRKGIVADTISGGAAATQTPSEPQHSTDAAAHAHPEDAVVKLAAQPGEDKAAKQACMTDLRKRIEDLALTEEQTCRYLHQFGLFGEGWKTFDQANIALLLHLCTPQGWKTFKELLAKEVKPKVVEKPVKPVRKGRGRKL